ncbi:MAG: antibiotic biosynthesis monooxygenase [Desulfosarcina sp.]
MNPKPTGDNDMGIVHSSIRMLIPLNKQSEALEILQTGCAQIQFNPNCISTHLYRGVDDARAVMIKERWTSDEHLSDMDPAI